MAKAKKTTKHGLDVKSFQDEWERQKEELRAIALEVASADSALVEAHREFLAAQKKHERAVARKTAAEARLNAVRSNLGGQS